MALKIIKKSFHFILTVLISIQTISCGRNNMKRNANDQTLRLNFSTSTISFHPHLSRDASSMTLCKALYEGLTRFNLKRNVELALAKKIEISPCKKIYTFTLRDSTWSNGEKVTSYHFENAWKKALDPVSGRCFQLRKLLIIKNAKKVSKGILPIDELKVYTLNDKTLVVELENPAPYFLQLLADPVYSPLFNSDSYKEPIIFNGPFIVKNYDPEKKLSLIPNNLYWDSNKIKLNEIKISFIKDEKTVFSLYEAGNFDWIGGPFSIIPNEVVEKISNIRSFHTASPFWVFFNSESQMLKSPKIRKALSYAIDRPDIVKGFALLQRELYSIIPSDISTLDEKFYIENYTIENAKKLFMEGLNDLKIKKDDFTFTLSHSTYPGHENIAVYLKHQWEKIFGIKISLKKDDWSAFISKMANGEFTAGGFYLCNIYDDPSYLLESFAEGSGCYSTWSNNKFREIIQKSKNATNENERKQHFKNAEELLMEEMPVCPIYNQNNLFLCKNELKNLYPPRFSYMDFRWAYFDYENQAN